MTTPPVDTFRAMVDCLKMQHTLLLNIFAHLDALKQNTPASGERAKVQHDRANSSCEKLEALNQQLKKRLEEMEKGFHDWAH